MCRHVEEDRACVSVAGLHVVILEDNNTCSTPFSYEQYSLRRAFNVCKTNEFKFVTPN